MQASVNSNQIPSASDGELTQRALAAYFRHATGIVDQPASDGVRVVDLEGKRYVTIENYRLLACYRVRTRGALKRLVRVPKQIEGSAAGVAHDLAVEVRKVFALASRDTRDVLERYPHAVCATADRKAIPTSATYLIESVSNYVMVFNEYGIPDPTDGDEAHALYNTVAEQLRRLPGVADAWWDSVNAGLQLFCVRAKHAAEVAGALARATQ